MPLKIRYFVPFDGLMGKSEELPLEGRTTVSGVCGRLAGKYPGFGRPDLFHHIVVLRNGKICRPGNPVLDGDEISILTFLVGG